jgi:hypothetical protein
MELIWPTHSSDKIRAAAYSTALTSSPCSSHLQCTMATSTSPQCKPHMFHEITKCYLRAEPRPILLASAGPSARLSMCMHSLHSAQNAPHIHVPAASPPKLECTSHLPSYRKLRPKNSDVSHCIVLLELLRRWHGAGHDLTTGRSSECTGRLLHSGTQLLVYTVAVVSCI